MAFKVPERGYFGSICLTNDGAGGVHGTAGIQQRPLALHGRVWDVTRSFNVARGERKDGARLAAIHWVKPEMIAGIEFTSWAHDGLLRQASLQEVRERTNKTLRPD